MTIGSNQNTKEFDKELIPEVLEKIEELIQQGGESLLLYDYLISAASKEEEKELIKSIKEEESKRNILFRKIYQNLSGVEAHIAEKEIFEIPKSYLSGIRKAMHRNLLNIDKYNILMDTLCFKQYKDLLLETIISGLMCCEKYNYLFIINTYITNSAISENLNTSKLTSFVDELITDIYPIINNVVSEFKTIKQTKSNQKPL